MNALRLWFCGLPGKSGKYSGKFSINRYTDNPASYFVMLGTGDTLHARAALEPVPGAAEFCTNGLMPCRAGPFLCMITCAA